MNIILNTPSKAHRHFIVNLCIQIPFLSPKNLEKWGPKQENQEFLSSFCICKKEKCKKTLFLHFPHNC